MIVVGSCAKTPKTKEKEGPECTILMEQEVEDRPREVGAAWASYGSIMEIQIQGYCSKHHTTEGFEMTFRMERDARGFLAQMWSESKAEGKGVSDKYLDELLAVVNSGYLSEYVYVYCRKDFWPDIPDLKLDEFQEWCAENLKDHKVETLAVAVVAPTLQEEFLQSVKRGDLADVKRLIKLGADVNAQSEEEEGYTPLIVASIMGHSKGAKLLIKEGADVNGQDKVGATALWYASGMGRIEIVKLLIEAGADVNAYPSEGVTALMIAYEHGHTEIVKLLIEAGAKEW